MTDRIRLSSLTFTGSGRDAARVEFGPSATIVRGPSDTGKSYIADSIDFMLGGRSLREIPELAGYTTVMLALELPGYGPVTITRSVRGGAFTIYDGLHTSTPSEEQGTEYGPSHDPKLNKGLSNYVLDALGLNRLQLRKSASNQKGSFTLRHLAHLTVVSEEQMQSRTPPPLTGNHTSATLEKSALKLLLVGEDDSALVEVPTAKERRTVERAKAEVITELLVDARGRVEEGVEVDQLRDQLAKLNETIRTMSERVEAATRTRIYAARELARLEQVRVAVQGRLSEADALRARFELLDEQYGADLDRLEMVSEAGTLLGYFSRGSCPFCGAEPEHQHANIEHQTAETTALAAVVAGERVKVEALRDDLRQAIADLVTESTELAASQSQATEQAAIAQSTLISTQSALAPQESELGELLGIRSNLESSIAAHQQIAELEALRARVEDEAKAEKAELPILLTLEAANGLSESVRARLRAWGFPGADAVRFDRNEFDLVDEEQPRASHGKGVRAVLHAAFTLGLADFCLENDLPHSGFVVLDSPLVTYKAPAAGEERDDESVDRLGDSFVARFYEGIQQSTDLQVVVMENTDPPGELADATADVEFTHGEEGRSGFLSPW